jgi:hypothetical protein
MMEFLVTNEIPVLMFKKDHMKHSRTKG